MQRVFRTESQCFESKQKREQKMDSLQKHKELDNTGRKGVSPVGFLKTEEDKKDEADNQQ